MIHLKIDFNKSALNRMIEGLKALPKVMLEAAYTTHKSWGEMVRSDLAKRLEEVLKEKSQEIRIQEEKQFYRNRQHEFSGAAGDLTKPIAGMSMREIEEFAHYYFWKQRVFERIQSLNENARNINSVVPNTIRQSQYEMPYNYLPAPDLIKMFPPAQDLIKIEHRETSRETYITLEPKAVHRAFPAQMVQGWSMPFNKEPPLRIKTGKEMEVGARSGGTLDEGYGGGYDIYIRPNDPLFLNHAVIKMTMEQLPKSVQMLRTEHERKTFYRMKAMLRRYGYDV